MNLEVIKLFELNELVYSGKFISFNNSSTQSETLSVVLETVLKSIAKSTKLVKLDKIRLIAYYSVSPYEPLVGQNQFERSNLIMTLNQSIVKFQNLFDRLNKVYPLSIGVYSIELIGDSIIPKLSTRAYSIIKYKVSKINRVENLLRVFYVKDKSID